MQGGVNWRKTRDQRMPIGERVLGFNESWGTQPIRVESPGQGVVLGGLHAGWTMRPKQWADMPTPA